jgi:hypothetical protein
MLHALIATLHGVRFWVKGSRAILCWYWDIGLYATYEEFQLRRQKQEALQSTQLVIPLYSDQF